jgi:hypothetical protein
MASRAMPTGPKLPFLKDRDFEDEAATSVFLGAFGFGKSARPAPQSSNNRADQKRRPAQ